PGILSREAVVLAVGRQALGTQSLFDSTSCALSCAAEPLLSVVISTSACDAARTGDSPSTHAVTAIVPSARLSPVSDGSLLGKKNCWRPATFTSYLRCPTYSTH